MCGRLLYSTFRTTQTTLEVGLPAAVEEVPQDVWAMEFAPELEAVALAPLRGISKAFRSVSLLM